MTTPTPEKIAHDTRLLAPAALTWVIAALAVAWTPPVHTAGLVGCGAAMLALVWLGSRRHGAHGARWSRPFPTLALCLLLAAAALISIGAESRLREDPPLVSAIARGGTAGVELAIDGIARPLSGGFVGGQPRVILPATLRQITTASGPVRAAVPVMVVADSSWSDLTPGTVVAAEARTRPGDRGEDTVAWIYPENSPQVRAPPAGWQRLAQTFRVGLRGAVRGLAPHAAGLVPGIAIGDDGRVPGELADAMRTSSLGHLLAVSGAHVAILLGLVQVLMGWAPVALRLLASVAAVGSLIIVVGPEPSVIRAGAMGAVAMLAVVLGRRSAAIPALCSAVIALVILDPWIAREIGFVLSVCATAGIVAWARGWGQWWQDRLGRAGWLAPAIAVPLAAQAACLPALLFVDSGIATWGVLANALVAPVIPVLTVLSLLATALSPLAPGVAHGLVWLAQPTTWWIERVATTCAGLPLARLPWPAAPGGAMLAVGLLAGGWWVLRDSRARALLDRTLPRLVRWWPAAAMAVAGILALSVSLPASRPAAVEALEGIVQAPIPGDWRFLACDVGQGTSVAMSAEVDGGGGRAVLIDTGPPDGRVAGCLREAGIDVVPLLILTHADLDHIGGLQDVLEAVAVERAAIPPTSDPRMAQVRDTLADSGVPVAEMDTSTGPITAGVLTITPVWPTPRAVDLARGDEERAVNDLSLTTWIAAPDLTVLAHGDLGGRAQAALAAGFPEGLGPPDVLLVAHHGSRDQDSPLLRRTAGAVSVISVGAENDYGHPAPATLEVLGDVASVVRRTDLCGPVAVLRRGSALEVTRC